jgi:hypothetical protein
MISENQNAASRLKRDVFLVGLLSLIFIVLYSRLASSDYFSYDESDYMYAAKQGFAINYLDRTSIPFRQFIELGMNQGEGSKNRASLSEFIRTSNDINIFRHFHGPAYFYYLMPISHLEAGGEFAARYASAMVLLLTAVFVFFLLQKLEGGTWASALGALLAAFLICANQANIQTATQITPHGMYTLFSAVSLLLVCIWLKTGDAKFFYGAAASGALSLLSVEYAVLLIGVQVIALLWWTKTTKPGKRIFWRMTLYALAIYLGVVLLVWPGGILKLGLLRNYAFFGYYAIVRSWEYGSASLSQAWSARFQTASVEIILILIAGIYLFAKAKKFSYLFPIPLYAILIIATTLRNADPSPQYYSSILPPLLALVGIAFSEALRGFKTMPAKVVLGAALSALLIWNVSISYRSNIPELETSPDSRKALVTSVIEAQRLFDNLIVERSLAPLLNYYDPGMKYASFSFSDGADVATGDISEFARIVSTITVICKQENVDAILAIPGLQIVEQKNLPRNYALITVALP